MNSNEQNTPAEVIQVPASTGWPLVAAFGLTFVFAGLLTHVLVSILGAVTLCMGLVGWFRVVLPDEAHESVIVEKEELVLTTPSQKVRHLEVGELGHRARLPLETYPYSAGVRGGLVGGVAMALVAILYGLIGHKSIWYPINLLAATGSADISAMSYDQLLAFSGTGLTGDQLIRQVLQGRGNMPAYGNNLNPAETTALVAYLKSLHPPNQKPAQDASLASATPASQITSDAVKP